MTDKQHTSTQEALKELLEEVGFGRIIAETPASTKARAALAEPDYWQEEARRYAGNADYWRKRYETLAEPVQEPVASVTECEACFTPDVCQLRGTCDHYAAERLRVAAPPQREPVHQWRKQMCAAWYDGHPDHSDGGGPYETRTLYTAPPQRKPLTREQAIAMWADKSDGPSNSEIVSFAHAIEAMHGIR